MIQTVGNRFPETESTPAAPLLPRNENELAEVVGEAAARRTPLAVVGGGTRVGLGRPMQTAGTLSTARMTGVTLYEPTELVLSARAGTPIEEIDELLAKNRQRLAFEPVDHRAIYGSTGTPTIGAVAAANLSGPRRIQAGAARDSLIGLRAVTGRGEAIASGGRVMKNVTGYDLVKFLAGSFGTLAVLSEVTFKVLPAPEAEATLVLSGLNDGAAISALSAALASPFAVTGAAHIPASGTVAAMTLVRLEGFQASVDHRVERLQTELAPFGDVDRLDAESLAPLWAEIRDLSAFASSKEKPLWRISAKPSNGAKVAETIRGAFDCQILFDWGGGLLWVAGDGGPDAGATAIRNVVSQMGGHATLIRAPADVRNAVDVFEPLAPPLMSLTRKLKAAFDPAGILNPGRMYAGV